MEKQPHDNSHNLEPLDLPDRTISQWRIVHETQPRLEVPHDDLLPKQPSQTIDTTARVADASLPNANPELTDDLVFGSGNLEEIFTDLFLDQLDQTDRSVDYVLQHDQQPQEGDDGLRATLVELEAMVQPQAIQPQQAVVNQVVNQVIKQPVVSPALDQNARLPNSLDLTLAFSPRQFVSDSYHRDAPMVNYEQLVQQLQTKLHQQQLQHQEQIQSLQASFQELLAQRDELEAQLKRHIATHHALQQSLRLLEKDHNSAEKQVQDLTQEVQTLREKFQKQFGHVQDYEAHINHWKEQAARHQNHAIQLSAALDRLISGKGGKLSQWVNEQSVTQEQPHSDSSNLQPQSSQSPDQQTTSVITAAAVNSEPVTAQTPAQITVQNSRPINPSNPRNGSNSVSHTPSNSVAPAPEPLPMDLPPNYKHSPVPPTAPQNPINQNLINQNPTNQNTMHLAVVNATPAGEPHAPNYAANNLPHQQNHPNYQNQNMGTPQNTNPTPVKRRVVELPSFLNRH